MHIPSNNVNLNESRKVVTLADFTFKRETEEHGGTGHNKDLKQAQLHRKSYYEQRACTQSFGFVEGNKVMLPIVSSKLLAKWQGPLTRSLAS